MRHLAALVLVGLLSACATMHGPQTITLSAGEVEQQIRADLGGVLQAFKGVDAPRPQVSMMPTAQRVQLEWTFTLPDGPAGVPMGVAVELTGAPVLNAARNGVDLTQVKVEDVRLSALPRFLGLSRFMDQKGVELPDLPLMMLPADRLRQSEVAYEATGVSVGYFGLRIDITPR
jgi:hypothetical protein